MESFKQPQKGDRKEIISRSSVFIYSGGRRERRGFALPCISPSSGIVRSCLRHLEISIGGDIPMACMVLCKLSAYLRVLSDLCGEFGFPGERSCSSGAWGHRVRKVALLWRHCLFRRSLGNEVIKSAGALEWNPDACHIGLGQRRRGTHV